jgi:blue copper oxidase
LNIKKSSDMKLKLSTSIYLVFAIQISLAQNALYIPPALTGKIFNLNVQQGKTIFYDEIPTPTYGVNGVWMAPTIIANKGDSITIHVTNKLDVKTTMHWHGFHVAAHNDGGPHQIILPSATWSPSFKIRNNAATFWYHPHGANQTEQQVSKGIAGFFIVKDSVEKTLNLPRTYGVDDIPLNIQTRAFDVLKQIAIADHMDTAIFVNGTLNAMFNAPAQVVRFRLLNGSSMRTYNFGLSNGQTFYQIATDGGMKDSSLAVKRLTLSPGERTEILVNFSGMTEQTVYLKSFASELPKGIFGAAAVGYGVDTIQGYSENFLNGADFNLLQLKIGMPTTSSVSNIPIALIPYKPLDKTSATNFRTIVFDTLRASPIDSPNLAEGPFGINNKSFDMDRIDETVYLNTTEIWAIQNKTLVAHPFHIHDIQFNVIERGGKPPLPTDKGWKDVVLVMPHDSAKFIARFTDFADNTVPYMFHCHLLHHEDDGMMGTFVVVDTSHTTGILDSQNQSFSLFPNPVSEVLTLQFQNDIPKGEINLLNIMGEIVLKQKVNNTSKTTLNVVELSKGVYFIQFKAENTLLNQKFIKQ